MAVFDGFILVLTQDQVIAFAIQCLNFWQGLRIV